MGDNGCLFALRLHDRVLCLLHVNVTPNIINCAIIVVTCRLLHLKIAFTVELMNFMILEVLP